ncbi:putative lipid II flippase FtsW [Pseudoflavonifractor sp. MSJ-30]|uniref:FtsW/RodA/SpoVE family cell cycle protein n=1 Tax=Pseudoflavonifractor sp. MSJ-30 TaxID=2841525 RepID=UPI001C0F94DB|nr:putative peptidoglycan glycosyltransferase FtsW [Pseudoflavonifractor sp. MSJ-30]MBU5452591.1 putative lipid II flippase FtsW [Pseudoflavonifractor sp. MSJ-30]
MAGAKLFAKEDRQNGAAVDIPFLVLTLLLLTVGLAVLYSASSAQSAYDTRYTMTTRYLQKQAVCAGLGLIAMWAFSRIPAIVWYRLAWPIYFVSIVLLLSVLVIGQQVNGAKRWINIAGLQFQPSEVAKFAMIVLLSRLTLNYGEKAKRFRFGVLGFGGALLGILVPLALEKHLSAIMLMGMVAVVMMYIAGTHPKWLLLGAAGAAVFLLVYIRFMGYAGDRVTAWRHPELDPGDTGYQILQSLYAIGSGGFFGLGPGKSRQKYLYLPFQYNDYIFAIVCEELGLVGALGIMAPFALLIFRGYRIARQAENRFSTALAAGLISLIAVQTILNLCVVTNLLPSTGIALPFFSYGGTALAVNLGEMGIVLNISRSGKKRTIQEAAN